jgi:glutathione-specific gamma-glutamylcyclotransferase
MARSGAMDGLKLTQELVARAHRMVEDSGPPPGRVPMTDEDYDTSLRQILGALPADDDIWLFAYGSLIWNPACETVERRPAVVPGWHRAFCFTVTRFRGSPDRPGLMMGLDRGGLCRGVAYRIPRADAWAELSKLCRREMSAKPSGNLPRILKARVDGREAPAIAFVVDRRHMAYAGRPPLETVADMLAGACGHWGSGAEYLLNTVLKLEEHGIRDRNLWRLQALVAERLAAMQCGARVPIPATTAGR